MKKIWIVAVLLAAISCSKEMVFGESDQRHSVDIGATITGISCEKAIPPLKFTSGTFPVHLYTPQEGAIEWGGNQLYVSYVPERKGEQAIKIYDNGEIE
jgi:hypothetical protein